MAKKSRPGSGPKKSAPKSVPPPKGGTPKGVTPKKGATSNATTIDESPRHKEKKDNNKKNKKPKRRPTSAGKHSSSKNVELPEDEKKKPCIPVNSGIETASGYYTVISKLGSGGFGQVYKVQRRSDKRIFAMKAEFLKQVHERRLKKEYELYREITRAKKRGSPFAEHLMEVVDFGECPGVVHFMFMPVCGPALEVIFATKIPTFATAIQLSIQALRAIQNFHSFGHIHRDIKPANYVIGRPPEENRLFLIDFGMAVRFCVDPKKMPKTSVYEFIGTSRYASRTVHQGMPQSRKDDLESWLYVVMEFFYSRILPWRHARNSNVVYKLKEKLFADTPADVFSKLPPCFGEIATHINTEMSTFEEPNYDHIRSILIRLAAKNKIALSMPLEFQEIGIETSTPKPPSKGSSKGAAVREVKQQAPTPTRRPRTPGRETSRTMESSTVDSTRPTTPRQTTPQQTTPLRPTPPPPRPNSTKHRISAELSNMPTQSDLTSVAEQETQNQVTQQTTEESSVRSDVACTPIPIHPPNDSSDTSLGSSLGIRKLANLKPVDNVLLNPFPK